MAAPRRPREKDAAVDAAPLTPTAERADRREALAVAAACLLAFGLRVAWVAYARFRPRLDDDAGRYDFLARSLIDGLGYINPNGTTTMFWPPGYPFLLALVYRLYPEGWPGSDVDAALLLNAALGAATVVLVWAVARRAFGVRPAVAAAAIVGAWPSLIIYAGTTLTETAFTFALMLAVWLIVESEERGEWTMVAAAGLVIGYAALIRGQAVLLPVVAIPFWLRTRGSVRATATSAALVAVLALAVVAPWTWRNYGESGSLVLISSNAGPDFYIGHSAGAGGGGRNVDELVFRYPDLPQAEAEARINRDGFREGLAYAAKHPLREVWLSVKKVWFLYANDDAAIAWSEAHGARAFLPAAARAALKAVSNAYYWLMLALAVIGGLLAVRRPPGDPRHATPDLPPGGVRLLLGCLLAYWTLAHIAFFGDARFHAPIVPVIAIFAAAGAVKLRERMQRVRPGLARGQV